VIPANGEYFASYTVNGKHRSRKVIAWNSNGAAMVADTAGLVPAQSLPGFETVYEGSGGRAIAALPGAGWLVDTLWEDGTCTTAPVLLWAVHSDGTATPMDTDHLGETGTATGNGERHYLYHPDHNDPEARKQAGFPAAPQREGGLTG
jgi:hypothetical protein